jgi:hypothetical protein
MVQCMMTEQFFFCTNAPRKMARCKVVLTMRPSLLGGNNRRRDQSRHSESEKQSETIETTNSKRGIAPQFFFLAETWERGHPTYQRLTRRATPRRATVTTLQIRRLKTNLSDARPIGERLRPQPDTVVPSSRRVLE